MSSESESPVGRLPWTISGALLALFLMLWGFGVFLSHPVKKPPEKPIEARMVEIPSPPAPKAVSRPQPKMQPRPEPKPEPKPEAPVKQAPEKPVEKPEPAKPSPPKPVEAPQEKGSPGGDVMGARVIYGPKPVIPEEFRDEDMNALVVARFHVAQDGSVKVELIVSTPNPDLNRSVLDTLSTWKFFPAMRDGKPVESVQDIRFRLVVQ